MSDYGQRLERGRSARCVDLSQTGPRVAYRYHQLTPGPVSIQLHSRLEARALSVGSHSLWRVYPEYGSGGRIWSRLPAVVKLSPARFSRAGISVPSRFRRREALDERRSA